MLEELGENILLQLNEPKRAWIRVMVRGFGVESI